MKLYHFPSPNPQKVTFALLELGLDCEKIPLDLAKGEQREPAFLAVNPAGRVPVLVDGDRTLTESHAILAHPPQGRRRPAREKPVDARRRLQPSGLRLLPDPQRDREGRLQLRRVSSRQHLPRSDAFPRDLEGHAQAPDAVGEPGRLLAGRVTPPAIRPCGGLRCKWRGLRARRSRAILWR